MIHPVAYEPSQDFGDNPTKHLPASHWIIQQFGNYQPDGHTGVDYPCPVGTQVRAAADGVVLHVGFMSGGYADNPWWIAPGFAGYVYVVDHGHFIGIYGHCKDASNWVNHGDRVKEGQTLGLSGNTGASTGPHLHFEVLPDGYNLYGPMYGRINPNSFFIGTVSYASTESVKLTPKEDELSAQEVQIIVDAINHAFHRTKTEIPGDTAAAVLTHGVPHKDPVTGQDTGQVTSLATLAGFNDFQHTATRDSLLAAVRGIVDAVKAAPGEDAARVAEEAYARFAEKISGIKVTVTAGDN